MSAGPDESAFDSGNRLAAFLIVAVAVVIGIVVGIANPFLRNSGSAEGELVDQLFSIALGIGTTVFVIVEGFLIFSIIRFARLPGDDGDGPPVRGNVKLEVFWTAVPAVTVIIIAFLSYQVLVAVDLPRPGEMVVEVTARQFSWEFYYPDADVTAQELHIPLGKTVLLKMHSEDVIHSFWVPAFRMKKDLMPDRETESRITATELGVYPILCAELCGAGHADMHTQLVVLSDAEFKQWLAVQGAERASAASGDPMAVGRRLFGQYGCNSCHTLGDAGAASQIGPSLDGIGSRAGTEVAGQTAEEYLHTSIVSPGDFVVPGYQNIMPQDYEQRMTDEEINALVEYLSAQQ